MDELQGPKGEVKSEKWYIFELSALKNIPNHVSHDVLNFSNLTPQ